MEKSTYYKIAFVLGAAAFSTGAFTKGVRKKIAERDNGKSVWSGETEGLTAAHINHDRKRKIYNDESNGRLLTWLEQYEDHFNRHNTEGLGLSESQNKWALSKIWEMLSDEQRKKLPPPEEVGKTIIPIKIKRR